MNQQPQYEDEISFAEIVAWLDEFKKVIMLSMFLVGLFGVLVSVLIPPNWEGQAILQVGQVGQTLEPIPNLVARMSAPSFLDLFELPDEDGYASFKVKKSKEADLLEITIKASSADQALKSITAISDNLIEAHEKIYDQKIQLIRSKISALNKQIELLMKSNNVAVSKNLDGSKDAVISAFLLQQNISRIYELNQRKDDLESSLDETISFNTRFVSGPNVSKKPVSPNKALIIALSLLLGLLFGLFFAFLKNSQKIA